jgi:hypothetical protein
MAGLVPAIHVLVNARKNVDARHKAGHDDELPCRAQRARFYLALLRHWRKFPIQISNSRYDFATSRRVTPELLQILPPR